MNSYRFKRAPHDTVMARQAVEATVIPVEDSPPAIHTPWHVAPGDWIVMGDDGFAWRASDWGFHQTFERAYAEC